MERPVKRLAGGGAWCAPAVLAFGVRCGSVARAGGFPAVLRG
ncbi:MULTISPECIES: hypothetical protein [Acetobacter]|uniref:Uncharacterized protein n=1 Tax=Acetobacter lovaniensis TaxID=104100 RepID=A0A841QDW0_9PROT|nr:hypothetical protein [Acetobacter lovaniensis]MBB6457079.1 hypothetical protein [Acetobacter lovaniensis]